MAAAELGAGLELGTRELRTAPETALLHVLFVAAYDAAMLQRAVGALLEHPEADTFVRADDGKLTAIEAGSAALYGPTYHLTGVFTGEGKPHVLWSMHEAAQERLHRVSASCLKAKIQDRAMQLAEEKGRSVADFGRHLVSLLGHSPNDPQVRAAMRQALEGLAASG